MNIIRNKGRKAVTIKWAALAQKGEPIIGRKKRVKKKLGIFEHYNKEQGSPVTKCQGCRIGRHLKSKSKEGECLFKHPLEATVSPRIKISKRSSAANRVGESVYRIRQNWENIKQLLREEGENARIQKAKHSKDRWEEENIEQELMQARSFYIDASYNKGNKTGATALVEV